MMLVSIFELINDVNFSIKSILLIDFLNIEDLLKAKKVYFEM